MTEPQDRDSVMLDSSLAAVLSRLAGLLGQAVPAHRFGMLSRTPDGVEVESLSREERLKVWWLSRFPMADIQTIEAKNLSRQTFHCFGWAQGMTRRSGWCEEVQVETP